MRKAIVIAKMQLEPFSLLYLYLAKLNLKEFCIELVSNLR